MSWHVAVCIVCELYRAISWYVMTRDMAIVIRCDVKAVDTIKRDCNVQQMCDSKCRAYTKCKQNWMAFREGHCVGEAIQFCRRLSNYTV